MKQPPQGKPMDGPRKDLDAADAETLKSLAENRRCQQRLITDRGQHYIYCGGYFHGKTR